MSPTCSMAALAETRLSSCHDLTGLYNITTAALAWNLASMAVRARGITSG